MALVRTLFFGLNIQVHRVLASKGRERPVYLALFVQILSEEEAMGRRALTLSVGCCCT